MLQILRKMKLSGHLDQDSNLDLYCLHLCFINLIKSHLKECRQNWNNRPSSKALTPLQLFHMGLMSLRTRALFDKAHYPELDQVTF